MGEDSRTMQLRRRSREQGVRVPPGWRLWLGALGCRRATSPRCASIRATAERRKTAASSGATVREREAAACRGQNPDPDPAATKQTFNAYQLSERFRVTLTQAHEALNAAGGDV